MLNAVTFATVSVLALGAPAATPATPATPATSSITWPQEVPSALDWEVLPAGSTAPAGTIEFRIGYHTDHHSSNWEQGIALSTLSGLTESQLATAGQPVTFVIRRDAGEFRCSGVAGQGKGVGSCAYAANPGFASALAKRGIAGDLGSYQQFELTMSDIGFSYLDELKRENYATPSTDDLVRAGTHGAGLKQLLAMNAAGYRFGDVATFVHARDHGVSATYIEALRTAGYTGLTATDLVRLRDHGVSVGYITELKNNGYSGLKADDLTHLRDHGVSAGFITELHNMGYEKLTVEELTRLRDHGISPGFIRVSNQSGVRLTPDELIRLRERGSRE